MELEKIFFGQENLYEKLKKLDLKKEKLKKLENNNPLIITLLGSPRTGKTNIANNIYDFLKKSKIESTFLPEPANEIYKTFKNDEEKKNMISDKISFNEKLKQHALKMISEVPSNHTIIYDRGYLDTFVWLTLYYKRGEISDQEYRKKMELLEKYYTSQNHLLFVLTATPEISIIRDYLCSLSLDDRKVIRLEFLKEYREALLDISSIFNNHVSYMQTIDTDNISVMDSSIIIANDICDYISDNSKRKRLL